VKKIISFLLFFIFNGIAFSQEINTNKLLKQFHTQPEMRMDVVSKLRHYYASNSSDSLLYVGNLALQKGIDDDNYSLMILGKLVLSNYYNRVGKMELSKTYLNQCISYYKRKEDYVLLADAENQMGISFLNSNNHPKAIEYFVKSLETSKNLPPDNQSFQGQLNLAEVYLRNGQFDLAEAEGLTYLERVKKLNIPNGIRRSYDVLGKIYIAKNDVKLGYSYHQKALLLALKGNLKTHKAQSYNNIAIIYFENGDVDLAKEYFLKGLKLRKETKNLIGITESYYNLGDWNYYQDQFKAALPFYFQSLTVADSNNLAKESADALYKIALSYAALKDYKLTSEFYSKFILANDKIEKSQRSEQIEMQRISYEMQRKEDQLIQSKRENILKKNSDKQKERAKIIIVIFSVLSSFLLLLYLYTVLKRNIQNNIDSKKAINPVSSKSENEVDLTKKMEALEGFLEFNQKTQKTENSYWNGKIKFTQSMQVFQLNSGPLIFWETNSEKLESYIFNNYMHSKINDISDLSAFTTEINKQTLIEPSNLTYGLICDQEQRILVCGNKGLLIQNENKMAFMTENKLDVKEYSVFVSENLKDLLIKIEMWDKFLKQIDMTNKMSTNMALTTIQDSWGEVLNAHNLGVIIVQPSS
jgi:tetratricopeptide (TPR) repeat protein